MNPGEDLRRAAYNALDSLQGGSLKKLRTVNEREIMEGVSPSYTERRLSGLFSYAKENCPFYRSLGKADSLSDFPVQNKADFIAHYDTVLSDEFRDRKDSLPHFSTSGSTGTPFTVLADPSKLRHYNMNYISLMELNGFRIGMKRGEFRAWIKGKNTISPWHSFRNNLIMMEISNMGEEALAGICEKIRRERIQVLVMYSSALTQLTGYLKKHPADLSKWSVEMIFTMGEALPEATFREAQMLFGITPIRSYGNNENGFIAMTIPGKEGYVIDNYNFHVEMLSLDSDEPVQDGELGRIVVTDYYNRAFPMIRYDTGDTGTAHFYTDEEGRSHGFFREIYGRRGSMLYNTKGEPLSIHVFMNILLKFEGMVKQGRCVQLGEKEYEILLNADPQKTDEAFVLSEYRKYLGSDANLTIRYVDDLPILASGKTMVCENRWDGKDKK